MKTKLQCELQTFLRRIEINLHHGSISGCCNCIYIWQVMRIALLGRRLGYRPSAETVDYTVYTCVYELCRSFLLHAGRALLPKGETPIANSVIHNS